VEDHFFASPLVLSVPEPQIPRRFPVFLFPAISGMTSLTLARKCDTLQWALFFRLLQNLRRSISPFSPFFLIPRFSFPPTTGLGPDMSSSGSIMLFVLSTPFLEPLSFPQFSFVSQALTIRLMGGFSPFRLVGPLPPPRPPGFFLVFTKSLLHFQFRTNDCADGFSLSSFSFWFFSAPVFLP